MSVAKTQEQQSGGAGERASSELTRVTVNLVPGAVRALEVIMEVSGDSQTDCINRSLRFNAAILKMIESGAELYVKKEGQETLERIIVL